MLRRVLFLLLAVLAGPVAHAEGTVKEGQFMASRILNRNVEFTLYLPPGYGRDDRHYPVIYLMHGGLGGQNSDWYRFGNAGYVFDKLIESGEVPPFIAVTPEGRRDEEDRFNTYFMNDADGGYLWQDMFFKEFVPYVEKSLPVVPARNARAILGMSMGGYAAIAFSLKHPDMFVAAAALSAAVRTDQQVVDMDQPGYDMRFGKAWGMGLKGSERLNRLYRDNSVLDLVDTTPPDRIRRTKLYIDCGSYDGFFAGNAALTLKLQKLDVPHHFIAREGGHDWTYWRTGLPDAVRFIGQAFMN
ncbi:alpha/beta hydrolase-fold protein [Neorhizobium sp. NCHU2750]|uniref:alpha/beta hydrolase n=1 Tax=Neorhizobium sp. NCHU2750 TaxID=1825976 RepID=UPI000E72CA97|nr:esterase [Neorhizobium sp. NCHU2750]